MHWEVKNELRMIISATKLKLLTFFEVKGSGSEFIS
jgi:hypothetical protein